MKLRWTPLPKYAIAQQIVVLSLDLVRRGAGKKLEVTDAEVICPASLEPLLRYDDERRWLPRQPCAAGTCFPGWWVKVGTTNGGIRL
jgi:hypothetical protein